MQALNAALAQALAGSGRIRSPGGWGSDISCALGTLHQASLHRLPDQEITSLGVRQLLSS